MANGDKYCATQPVAGASYGLRATLTHFLTLFIKLCTFLLQKIKIFIFILAHSFYYFLNEQTYKHIQCLQSVKGMTNAVCV